ncbi:hypothetical protein PR202_gb00466 [Eleusine coracana subsp. coracana]|uniref:Protein FAR1-RELATED SEQUENCE n=1 Tax=Eleusine coracana subsp. coracana TaxID=191504 RepID=A0AAV5DT60_ELECO|nr:hypothetical protein PR202_gb00466 [Eleusine coracana subsp. coracana]
MRSFPDFQETDNSVMEAFVNCIWDDDKNYRPELVKEKLILHPQLAVCANMENYGSQHNPDAVFSEESLDTAFDLYMTNDIAWRSIKLILIPVIDRGHYSLYVVNFEASRVDVLDTLDYDNAGTTWLYRHGKSGATVITRLNALLQKKSRGALKKFGNFKLTKFSCPTMVHPNDCTFLTMKYAEHYTGVPGCIDDVVNPEKSAELRAEYLYYLLFHPSNKAEIPEDLSPVHSSHVVSSEATKGMETPSSRVRFAAMVSNQAPDSPEYYTVPCSAPDLSPRVSPPPTTAAPGLTRQGFPSPTCPDRHTPPATINSDEMATPDPQQTYTHPHDINPEIVPRVGMVFSSEEQAKLFYKRYAREAGFPMKLSRTKKSVREICCSRIGKGEYYLGDEEERQRNNTSKKSGCKAYIKLHRDRDENWCYFPGLFCVHLLRVFMQLNVESIPATYILRGTQGIHISSSPFDRNDLRLSGSDGTTHSLRTTELLTEAMGVVRAAAMSSVGRDRAMDVLRELRKQLEALPPDLGPQAAPRPNVHTSFAEPHFEPQQPLSPSRHPCAGVDSYTQDVTNQKASSIIPVHPSSDKLPSSSTVKEQGWFSPYWLKRKRGRPAGSGAMKFTRSNSRITRSTVVTKTQDDAEGHDVSGQEDSFYSSDE